MILHFFRIENVDEMDILLGKPNLSDQDLSRVRTKITSNPEILTYEKIRKIFELIEFRTSCEESAMIALLILEKFPTEKERIQKFISDNKTLLRRKLAKL